MYAMDDPRYKHRPWSQERRARASETAKRRISAKNQEIVMTEPASGDEYLGAVETVEDFLRCSHSRRKQVLGVIGELIELSLSTIASEAASIAMAEAEIERIKTGRAAERDFLERMLAFQEKALRAHAGAVVAEANTVAETSTPNPSPQPR